MPSLTLISHHLCPYVQRAAIALLEKGAPFERIMIDLDAKPDWFLKLSPLGKVPLLRVSSEGNPDAILFESSVICEFIEETQTGPALHPADPLERAQHRAWMEFGSSILADIWGIETARDPAVLDAKWQAAAAKFARIEAALGAGPYFAGERFSMVDAVFGPVFRYFRCFRRNCPLGMFDATPKVQSWRRALAERPSVREAVDADYGARLKAFMRRYDAHLLTRAA